jgi:rhodanese-related sulfurtransferase
MFLATVWEWVLPIGLGLVLGVLISLRRKHDYSQIVLLKSDEFRANMRKGQLIDIRKEDEFQAKRINGSRNFPKMSLSASLHKIRKDQPIFLYDHANGPIMRRLSRKLIRKGFHPVYVLQGGIQHYPFPLKED